MTSPPTPDLFRAHARPWRILFVAYAIGLTVATHWPDFRLAPEVPATDKSLHMLAFAGLAWLLWRTRWIRTRRVVALVGLV